MCGAINVADKHPPGQPHVRANRGLFMRPRGDTSMDMMELSWGVM